ncbi:hypothetical protein B0H12DRAFT_1066965 [Mycena haematopus]|nr:hypothetical protein B0H12DRAFT_1066965 [Mycena haematopus]
MRAGGIKEGEATNEEFGPLSCVGVFSLRAAYGPRCKRTTIQHESGNALNTAIGHSEPNVQLPVYELLRTSLWLYTQEASACPHLRTAHNPLRSRTLSSSRPRSRESHAPRGTIRGRTAEGNSACSPAAPYSALRELDDGSIVVRAASNAHSGRTPRKVGGYKRKTFEPLLRHGVSANRSCRERLRSVFAVLAPKNQGLQLDRTTALRVSSPSATTHRSEQIMEHRRVGGVDAESPQQQRESRPQTRPRLASVAT